MTAADIIAIIGALITLVTTVSLAARQIIAALRENTEATRESTAAHIASTPTPPVMPAPRTRTR